MDDRYTAGLAARVGRDLAGRERYLLAVPLLPAGFTFTVTLATAAAAGLGSFAAAGSGAPSWVGAACGAALGALAGVLVTRWRQRRVAPTVLERPATMAVLAITDRRYLLYRRSIGNQARERIATIPRAEVAAVEVAPGSFLHPRPVVIRFHDGTVLQFEGVRADSVGRLPAAAGGPAGGAR